ncbi:hypothetical protein [Pedobacter jamesrossensis]|uniref:hypothetical protein n=1 Tax=Pedobacter jamesrossensis TaxID=1908238 RepID=UPI00361ACD0A
MPPLTCIKLKRLPVVADFLTGDVEDAKAHLNASNQLTEAEIQLRRATLYKQKPLLKIENLSTWYPINNVFLFKSKRIC